MALVCVTLDGGVLTVRDVFLAETAQEIHKERNLTHCARIHHAVGMVHRIALLAVYSLCVHVSQAGGIWTVLKSVQVLLHIVTVNGTLTEHHFLARNWIATVLIYRWRLICFAWAVVLAMTVTQAMANVRVEMAGEENTVKCSQ